MIVIDPTQEPIWESQDAAKLVEFLTSETGQRFLNALAFAEPEFEDGSNGNKTLVASGKVQGYQLCLRNIVSLRSEHPTEPKKPDNYPSLDDDSQWEHVDKKE